MSMRSVEQEFPSQNRLVKKIEVVEKPKPFATGLEAAQNLLEEENKVVGMIKARKDELLKKLEKTDLPLFLRESIEMELKQIEDDLVEQQNMVALAEEDVSIETARQQGNIN